jgi:SAM-dependent methyltransferase
MAFTYVGLKYLLEDFKKRGAVPHGKLLTLSKYLIAFTKQEFNNITNFSHPPPYEKSMNKNNLLNDKYVFKALGFESVESMDTSDYEGADIIHDLNSDSVPKKMKNRYDFILDGGTMEHIFHIPNVLKSIYKMLKIDGVFLFNTPIFLGINHGYYNFSPTLFYEYFNANNYVINQMSLYAYSAADTLAKSMQEIKTMADDIYADIPIENGLYYMLCGSVTKTIETTCDVIPQQRSCRVAWEQAKKQEEEQKTGKATMHEILTHAEENSVYLYGAGNHTKVMLDNFSSEFKNKIAGILSNEPEEIGKDIYGYKVSLIDDIKKNSCIVISSMIHQNIIYDRIKYLEQAGFKIVKLYKEESI